VLVPALMRVLGALNWWLPSWLEHLLPNLEEDDPAALKASQPAIG
jgi:RND superfamily putative drug exporter